MPSFFFFISLTLLILPAAGAHSPSPAPSPASPPAYYEDGENPFVNTTYWPPEPPLSPPPSHGSDHKKRVITVIVVGVFLLAGIGVATLLFSRSYGPRVVVAVVLALVGTVSIGFGVWALIKFLS